MRIIANPSAGRGHAGRIAGLLPDAETVMTRHPGHATELAANYDGDVVAVGGDGTVHEVVNGLLTRAQPGGRLGIIPTGSGCDYVKTHAIPTDIEHAAAVIRSGKTRSVDAGRITCVGADSHLLSRYFINIAEVGLGAEVVAAAAELPRWLGAAVYAVALPTKMIGWKPVHAVLTGDVGFDSEMTNMVVAIGQVFGGGMRVAPAADPSDGLFDVQIQHGRKLEFLTRIPKVFKGTHLPHPGVTEAQGRTITVDTGRPVKVEADGEVLGTTPATFSIIAGAIEVFVP